MSSNPLAEHPGPLSAVAGLSAPVGRGLYLKTGLVLMLVKYGLDALVVMLAGGGWLSPLVYLLPVASLRLEALGAGSELAVVALLVLTLPFAWVGGSMSVRRARDAGLHPAWGLLFFVPLLNYLAIAVLAAMPSGARPERSGGPLAGAERGVAAALTGVGVGAVLLVGGIAGSTLILGQYGGAVFVGSPFVMASVAGLLYNLRGKRSVQYTVMVGVLTQMVAGGLLLLFAVEGAICLVMAAPLALVVGPLGALLGRELARMESSRAMAGPVMVLPLLTLVEPPVPESLLHVAETEVVVNAPPEVVWDTVVAFPEIPTDDLDWFFRAGVAWPLRARIEGTGVGAVRYCEFSTGPFVEPITTWDPPHHLAFDVVDQPVPMEELSPWDVVPAPHLLDGTLMSRRGEFRLEALEGGRTRLVGRTWYTLDMAPVPYWSAWSTALIHRIHLRVLGHIAVVSEAQVG